MPQYFGKLPTTDQPWTTISAVQAISQISRTINFECGDSCLAISIIAANLIRVRLAPSGEFMQGREWAVTLDDAEWAKVPFEVRETDRTV